MFDVSVRNHKWILSLASLLLLGFLSWCRKAREIFSLLQGRIAAIATAQRAWLLSAQPLQTVLRNFLDVIAPDADETLARYSRARVKFDAFRSEVVCFQNWPCGRGTRGVGVPELVCFAR